MSIISDQELLQLAAKAIGCESSMHSIPSEGVFLHRDDWPVDTNGERPLIQWNPLINDNETIALTSKLRLRVDISGGVTRVDPILAVAANVVEPHGEDAGAATRRAIVRAAAEIGRAMP